LSASSGHSQGGIPANLFKSILPSQVATFDCYLILVLLIDCFPYLKSINDFFLNYPDSRWLTGVDRTATHGDKCLETDFANSDFKLGWYVHYRCDTIPISSALDMQSA
jgi:hypothetical protein